MLLLLYLRNQVTFKALQQRTLRLSVYDVDRSKRHKLIGHALYPLKDLDIEAHQKVIMWLDLEKECSEVGRNGESLVVKALDTMAITQNNCQHEL